MSSDLVIGMAGSGGDGIVSAGEAIMTAAALEGWSALLTKSFGPQIRGGESSCRVRLSTQPALSSGGTLDVAVALNWEDFLKFGSELPVDGRTTVIYDAAAAARDRVRLGDRLLEPDPGLHHGLRLQQRARPRTADRAGDQAREARAAGAGCGW